MWEFILMVDGRLKFGVRLFVRPYSYSYSRSKPKFPDTKSEKIWEKNWGLENEMMGIVWNGFWWSLEGVGVDFGG